MPNEMPNTSTESKEMSAENVKLRESMIEAVNQGRLNLEQFEVAVNNYKTSRAEGNLSPEKAKDLDEKITIGEEIITLAAKKKATEISQ